MNLAESALGRGFIEQGVKLLMRNPAKNMPLTIKWVEKVAREEHHKRAVAFVKELFEDKDSNWYEYITRLLNSVHPNLRERIFINFLVNGTLLGIPKQKEASKELGASVPWAILMDPTERCNLNCVGCWAGKYGQAKELEFDLMDRICSEAEELGIYFIVISGGEPLMRKEALIQLAKRHPLQVFHVFTNGIAIDKEFVEEVKRLGNIMLTVSIEGFEEATDRRRGKGVFRKLMERMDLMRDNGILFGISTTYTRKNTEELASDEFIDLMIEKGAYYAWYFTYIPIGKDVNLGYMATPEQRKYMFERIKYFRKTKPFFIADFWNDGEKTEGCIAGGRKYFHINASGDVEPCAFVHYAACNIRGMSIKEALQNPLFKEYQKRQPFNDNMLCPCPLIDNPEKMREMVYEAEAYPTQLYEQDSVDEFANKMCNYAEKWQKVANCIVQNEK